MHQHKHEPIHRDFDWNDSYHGDASDYEPPNERILALLEGTPPGRALEVGCGAGGLAIALVERGWTVTGIDIAQTAIAAATAVAQQRRVELSLEVADARTYRPEGTFELVTNSFALPLYRSEREPVYAMMRDALAPGGRVVLEEFDPSMAQHGHLSGVHLVSIEELERAFPGFEILRAEIIETPPHDHGGGAPELDFWSAVIFCARKPEPAR